MFNRIRVVTLLIMVLGVFALLQFVSGGLFFLLYATVRKVLSSRMNCGNSNGN